MKIQMLNYLRTVYLSRLSSISLTRDQYITRIAIAIVCGIIVAYFFKISTYDKYIGVRKFPDYGPTLFSGGHPDLLLYLYIVLVAASVIIGWVLTTPSLRILFLDRWVEGGRLDKTASVTLLLMIVTVTITGITTGGAHIAYYKDAFLIFLGLGFAAFIISRPLMIHAVVELEATGRAIIAFLFTAIVLFHLPKIPVLHEIFLLSGHKYASTGLFMGMLILAVALSYFLVRSRPRSEWIRLSLILAGIYVVSIREAWIYWGLDAFHEGESFLTVNLLVNGPYKFLIDFFPVHGLGRNILHSYYAAIFSDNNLYFYRVIKALTYPFIHVLIFAFLYRYTKRVTVPLAFFVLSYMLGFVEELDIEPFMLIAFLMVPLSGNNKTHIGLQVGAGIALFMASVYSLEYFILLNIAMMVTALHYLYVRIRFGNRLTSWMHIAFYACLLLFVGSLGSKFLIWLDIVRNALAKSPNLLERSLELPNEFSLTFFLVSAFFAPFLLFHIASIVTFFRKPRYVRPKAVLVVIFSMLSLMFFVRAFNRSDIGHVLYAYSISAPAIIALATHYKLMSERLVVLMSMALLTFIGANYASKNQLNMDMLRQRPLYDSRLSIKDVRPLQDFGAIQLPAGTVSDSQMTAAELSALQSLLRDGYRIFDMTNQPVLIYGAVKSPLVTSDIHTLFYNTYREQMGVIKQLKDAGKTLVLWSANHWSETLDSTYVEYRLPILSQYLIHAYPLTYRIGRFVIFSEQTLPEESVVDGLIRDQYDLGFAPSRMGPYQQESATTLMKNTNGSSKIGEFKPDALVIEADATKGGRAVIDLRKNGRLVCVVTFNIPEGNSKNFVRLSNLPAYVRYEPDEISVNENDPDVRINEINYLKLSTH